MNVDHKTDLPVSDVQPTSSRSNESSGLQHEPTESLPVADASYSKQEAPRSSDEQPTSFAEVALRLGGASAEEARRTGAVDTADDQVEDLFAPQ